MVLVVDALDTVARKCSLDAPASWLSATDREYVEIRDDFLRETVDDVLLRTDLPSPIGAQTVITGTGVETYDLPSDFLRVQRDPMAVYESTTVRRALKPVTDDGQWTYLQDIGTTGTMRYYRVTGYDGSWSISFYKEPPSSITVTVSYVSKNWAANASGTAISSFGTATDVLLLPRRLVEAGTFARWADRYGVNGSNARREYEMLINKHIIDTRAIRDIPFGPRGRAIRPWDIPVPDEIPSS